MEMMFTPSIIYLHESEGGDRQTTWQR